MSESHVYKKYIRFDWDQYYPSGGLSDMTGTFDTLEEAISFVPSYGLMDYFEIVDRDTWGIVWPPEVENGSG